MYNSLFCSSIHNDNVVRKYTTASMKFSAVCVLLLVPLTEVYSSFRFTGNVVQVVNAVDLGEHLEWVYGE